MPKRRIGIALTTAFIFLLFLTGCTGGRAQLQHFDQLYYTGSLFSNAYAFSKKMAKKNHSNILLWDLQKGMSALMEGDYSKSLHALDAAEFRFNHHQNLLTKSLSTVGAVFVNDNVRTYTGNIYESVFINYYKAMDYLLLHDRADARVEFNRANDRQRRAKEFYSKEIRKAIDKMREQGSSRLDAAQSDVKVQEILTSQYSNLDNFYAYDNLINPVVSYLSGLFFALDNDTSKGLDYIKEAYGISHSTTIGEDLLFFSHPSSSRFTWIFIEDGKQATKKEFKINIPLPTPDGIYDASLALPQLKVGRDFHNSFSLRINNQQQAFEPLLFLDGLIASEFKKQLPYILTRAITSSVLKLGIEAVSNQYLGRLGGLFSSLYAAVSTSADIRSASVFPHKIYILRISNSHKSRVHIQADGQDIYTFAFKHCLPSTAPEPNTYCSNQNHILYIRSFEFGSIVRTLW
ncbi:COG3014 family protein [Helicobacter suis]|uniref:COG3014 family protein n=1 Tax=Helicobacter suis TaxID=104628 RepID=UPI0002D591D3|nr:hypothetical protein [Helicobacter suis]BCD47449.1 Putative lipoprotein [Helicobacter suis]